MSVQLTITVAAITTTLTAGYTHIKVYRSPKELESFFEITTPSAMIELQVGQSVYSFTDFNGTPEHWYRSTFYDANTPKESAYSTSFKGEFTDTNVEDTHYPEEGVYTSLDRVVIDKIRTLIGDKKALTRDYVSASTGYTTISEDGYTHTLSNPRGWPIRVVLDGVPYTDEENPEVEDYQFLTFSGTQISTTSGTLDVWYYHFRFSDSEILRVYNALTPPYPLTSDQVTFELAILSAAIEILLSEITGSSSDAGVEVDIFEEIRINPKVGLDSRFNSLAALLKLRKDMIDAIIGGAVEADLYGVLID